MRNQAQSVKPISIWLSLLIFGVPGVVIYAAVHLLVPVLVAYGIPLIFAWSACVLIPTVANAIAVLTFYWYQEKPDWPTFVSRFRLRKLPRKYGWLIPLCFVLILVCNEAMAWTIPLLSDLPIFAPAALAPEIFRDPYQALTSATPTFMDVPLISQNWWLLPFWAVWVVFGVLGEELVWRGYLLPRHEATYGKWAWLVNGALWNTPFHLYTLSSFFADMPFYLILPFVIQRIKNTWLAIFIHALMVSMAYVIIISGLMDH
ncbi:MAG: CPBP family intramembrane glutamic endopeptidase [Cyanobacteria bacterium P01_H01_bin.153]